jgi:DNA-binding transcriptional regulator YdaS (Cro superfamily)
MNLREWLDKEEMGISEFSKIIGYHESTIGRYLLGKMKISRKTANAIEKATGGKVKVSTTLALNPRKSKSKMDKEARDTQKRTEMQLVEEKGEKQLSPQAIKDNELALYLKEKSVNYPDDYRILHTEVVVSNALRNIE